MTGTALVLPIVLPLVVAGLLTALPGRAALHRAGWLATSAAVVVDGAVLLASTRDGDVIAERIGGWPAGIAISLAADTLSALLIVTVAVVQLACGVFAAGSGDDRRPFFVPLVLITSAGAYGAFLTADLFNLFVMVEVMLVPSYVLLTTGGGRERITAGRVYVTVNLLASTIFLAGVGLVYAVAGTVDLGELAGAGATGSGELVVAGAVVLLALAVKAAVVPLHGWLPRSYPYAPPTVTVLFSGILTKVGVYAILRIVAVVYDGAVQYQWLIGIAAVVTMVIGVLGALGEHTMRTVLAFHMVSQIGYLLIGLALFSPAALTAAIFFLVQYILVKAALFLSAGAVTVGYGTDRLDRLGGLAAVHRLLALAYIGAALSLAGMPPFSGFLAKFLLLRAAAADGDYLIFTVAVVVSLGTLISMIKIWDLVFWGEPPSGPAGPAGVTRAPNSAGSAARPEPGAPVGVRAPVDVGEQVGVRPPARIGPAMTVPALALAVATLLLGPAAAPLLDLAAEAAAGLIDPQAYVEAVTGR
ncbi:monovalent cation/H+ antiporter subunit D family protein [Solwaraspora sp. WMMD791]|uniref:monovalent cation/H+ antiporter subunit D family protein n=1 Tax=Solwaraspora sp. WMMD791 TaxID=3016086 RepID=UPI00249A935B|nr:monovalent cation/H+ antiporter subunit D family protein [Solwaraspora sp. WMMD791]WFE29406.1 monovalent cation/H+ antiporter subunit D family protein [Solwaraspora sp. WMMD791]